MKRAIPRDSAQDRQEKERGMSPQDIAAKLGENIGTSEWVEMS